MNAGQGAVAVGHFGKLPSHGDFVAAPDDSPLPAQLDEWLATAMQDVGRQADWEGRYDRQPPRFFLFLHTGEPLAYCGYLLCSRDASGRRFPFAMASAFGLNHPWPFVHRAPLALSRLWRQLERQTEQLGDTAARPASTFFDLLRSAAALETDARAFQACHEDFMQQTRGHAVTRQLEACGHRPFSQFLEQVTNAGVSNRLSPFPLVTEPPFAFALACFWLDLALHEIRCRDTPLCLFLDCADQQPELHIAVGLRPGAALAELLNEHSGNHADSASDRTLAAEAWAESATLADVRQRLHTERRLP